MPQLRKGLTNGASQAGGDQTPEKQGNAAGKTTVNLDNQFQKAKTTHNRNVKKANNGIRVTILFSAGEVVIASLLVQQVYTAPGPMPIAGGTARHCRQMETLERNSQTLSDIY